MFLGYALYAVEIWKGDILVADIEELETMDASEIYSKKTQCKRDDISQRKWKIHFPAADGRIKFVGGDQELRTSTSIRDHPIRGEYQRDFFLENQKGLFTTSRLTSGCRWSDKCFLVHVRKLQKPPSRWTQSQAFLAERRIIPYSTEVHWRLQNYTDKLGWYARKPHRGLLEFRWVKRCVWFLDRSHSVYSIRRETSRRISVFRGERLTKRQVTSRPDHLWPELWIKLGRNAKLRDRQKWSNEKPKLGNARRLRGIYFIDLEEKEFKKKPLRILPRNWKHQWLP